MDPRSDPGIDVRHDTRSTAGSQDVPAEDRVPRPDVDATAQCPYLGLRGDPATQALFPSANHRCFARRAPWAIPYTHQVAFCLAQYDACAIYAAVQRQQRPPEGAGLAPAPTTVTEWLRRWLWVSLLVALLASVGTDTVFRARISPSSVPIVVVGATIVALAVSLGLVILLTTRRSPSGP